MGNLTDCFACSGYGRFKGDKCFICMGTGVDPYSSVNDCSHDFAAEPNTEPTLFKCCDCGKIVGPEENEYPKTINPFKS